MILRDTIQPLTKAVTKYNRPLKLLRILGLTTHLMEDFAVVVFYIFSKTVIDTSDETNKQKRKKKQCKRNLKQNLEDF